MRLESIVFTLAMCALIGCSRSEDSENAGQAADSESGAPAAAGTADESRGTEVAVAYVGYDYTCSDGANFNARLDKGNTLLTLDGKTLTLTPVKGSFDAQYEGEGVMFVARGNEATLMRASGPSVTCKAK